MEKFTYKQAFLTQEVEVSKEMISYKGKNIPTSSITGIGVSFVNIKKVFIGQLLGGAAGSMLAQGASRGEGILVKDPTKIPEDSYGQIIITYNPDGQKQKVLRIPINTKEEVCKRLIESLIKNSPDKFIGFGEQTPVEKALKISHLSAYIFVAVVILAIAGYGIFAMTQPQ